jgi:stage IV sporulation protein FB
MTLLGARWRVHPLWALFLAAALLAGYLPEALIALSCLLTHELAHLAVAAALGHSPSRITLYPFGGVAEMAQGPLADPHEELLVAVAGPLSGFLLAGIGHALLGAPAWAARLDTARLHLWVDLNLAMASFNCLPALPLDGGSMLRAAIARRVGLGEATRQLFLIGRIAGAAVAVGGMAVTLAGGAGVEAAVLGGFLFLAAAGEARKGFLWAAAGPAARRARLTRLGVVEGRVLVARATTPVGEVLRAMSAARYHLVWVVDGPQDVPLGVLTEAALERSALRFGLGAPVGKAVTG